MIKLVTQLDHSDWKKKQPLYTLTTGASDSYKQEKRHLSQLSIVWLKDIFHKIRLAGLHQLKWSAKSHIAQCYRNYYRLPE